jgi:predicted O-methyltransferase YrrM
MEFTVNWFENAGKSNFENLLLPEFKDKKFNYLEIGCFEGMATRWVLENFPEVEATVVDTFKGGVDQNAYNFNNLEERFTKNIKPWLDRVKIRKGLSVDVLVNIYDEFDVIYVDASHLPADVLSDIILSWRLLKSGGIMILDDYAWSNGVPRLETPKIAIDSFLACYEGKYELLIQGYQVAIKKL